MWVRKRIDIRWSDLAVGLSRCIHPGDRHQTVQRLETLWSSADDAFSCLSVRSGFDLLFQALNLPADSEVVMTAVTIPDMPRIVREHKLRVIPVDLDMERMAPDLDQLEAAITERTKVIVVAHLFGGKVDLAPIARIAKRHQILLVEDCAQAFVSLQENGHPEADVSMFSFGPIKTNTALGGALFRVQRPELLRRMRELHQSWPTQGRLTFARRLLKYAFVQVLSTRLIAGTVAGALRLVGRDHDGIATSMARGFAGPNFFERIRKQPSTPLLFVLDRRLRRFRTTAIDARIERGEFLQKLFADKVPLVGYKAESKSYWVYPILVDEPEALVRALWAQGFDATWHSSLTIIEPDVPNRPRAVNAERTLAQTVFLPFSRSMPLRSLQRMGNFVLQRNPLTKAQLSHRLEEHRSDGMSAEELSAEEHGAEEHGADEHSAAQTHIANQGSDEVNGDGKTPALPVSDKDESPTDRLQAPYVS